jgi:hypothetical protein
LRGSVFCAKHEIIVQRLTVTGMVLAALFMTAVRLPAMVCPVASSAIGKACQGCCANKTCCADSKRNQNVLSTPIAKDSCGNQELVAAASQIVTAKASQFTTRESSPRVSAVFIADSAPQPAFLCTFLI